MVQPKAKQTPSFSSQEELESMLLEGLDSGEPIEVNPEFWRGLEAEIENRKVARRKAS